MKFFGVVCLKKGMVSFYINNKFTPVTVVRYDKNFIFWRNKTVVKLLYKNNVKKKKNLSVLKKIINLRYYSYVCNFKNVYNKYYNFGDMLKFAKGGLKDIFVKATSRSIGKGFSGVIKRWGFSSGNKTHGNTKSHRTPGSIGMCQDPGRVFKGKKMPGQMGNKRVSVRNVKIVHNFEYNIFLYGSIPGKKNSMIKLSLC